MKKNRRDFLKTACRNVVFASFGISIIEACSAEDEGSIINNEKGSSSNEPLVLNLNEGDLTALKTVGGWLNYTSKNILLLRISANEVRVFDNKCPHQGNRDRWSYDGSSFECGYHNNSYSNSCNGALTCYTAKLEGDTLTITF
jgi:nitrite reductase/ring-hydroxylating ferredoxin subunit